MNKLENFALIRVITAMIKCRLIKQIPHKHVEHIELHHAQVPLVNYSYLYSPFVYSCSMIIRDLSKSYTWTSTADVSHLAKK